MKIETLFKIFYNFEKTQFFDLNNYGFSRKYFYIACQRASSPRELNPSTNLPPGRVKPAAHEAFPLPVFGMGALVCNLEACQDRNDVAAGCLSG